MSYFVYIMSNYTHSVLYAGITNNLELRVLQHKTKIVEGFTSRYNCNQLIYYCEFNSWVRKKKDELISDFNPEWRDLSKEIDSSLRSE